MHRKKLMHGKLKDMKSYVVVGDEQQMKIINIENKLTRDKERQQKLQDLRDFKVMLRDLSCRIIGEEANNWNDLTLFLNFFDKGSGYEDDIFVDQLIEHPFLKTPIERIKLYAGFHQKILTRTLRRFCEFERSKSFGGYLPWNTKKMAGWMTDIYDYKHANKYDGNRPADLIRFVKNIRNHYAKKKVPIEVVDAEVRRLYSEFFNEVHVFS
ncbi:uncharacterized protein LOC117613136 [Prunus dulcis]|nr:uncharacterized protein LOC117613136 [Prunus dulcis]